MRESHFDTDLSALRCAALGAHGPARRSPPAIPDVLRSPRTACQVSHSPPTAAPSSMQETATAVELLHDLKRSFWLPPFSVRSVAMRLRSRR